MVQPPFRVTEAFTARAPEPHAAAVPARAQEPTFFTEYENTVSTASLLPTHGINGCRSRYQHHGHWFCTLSKEADT
jgi:hypothetical protein